ncbi:MAG: alpha/beta hydrolase [Pseudomonadota bacterium]
MAVLVWLVALAPDGLAYHDGTSDRASRGLYIPVATRGSGPINLYAEEYGQGRPVLLLHGLAASTYSWRRIVHQLARRNRVIALDLKGFGRSDKPFDTAYTPADHADAVVAFIRKTRLRRLTLVGHSYGGAIALLVADRLRRAGEGQRLRDLVIMGAPAYPQKPTAFIGFMSLPVLPYAVLSSVPPELTVWAQTAPEFSLSMAEIHAYARPYWSAAARHALITTSRQIVPDNISEVLGGYRRVSQPVLLVWCRDDETVPVSTGRLLARAMPNARLKLLNGCLHSPQDEQPAHLLRLLKPFLRN